MTKILKTLNGIQTSLLIWGDPFNTKDDDSVVVCITGNPGLIDFYTEFGAQLQKSTSKAVCIIGQAGHEELPGVSNILENQERLYNLEGQIAHKLDLINCIDKTFNIHLIGHSIGAWQIIELISKRPEVLCRISSINLLFPTIQKMASSPNGKFLNCVLRRIHVVALLVIKLLRLLPDCINNVLIHVYLFCHSLPSHYYERVYKVLSPSVMEKVMFLAFDEMDTVINLNKDCMEKIKHLTNVIYSDRDKWAPVTYMEDLKHFEPELRLEEVKVSHAFVLKSSELIAEKVANFIRGKCKI